MRVGSQQPAADDERRIEASLGEHRCDQACRRRLAVRAGDRNPCFRRMSSASINARGDGNPAPRAARKFRVVRRHRRRDDDRIRTVRIGSAMSDGDVDAQVAQAARRRTVDEVGPGDAVAQRRKHLGNAAHAGAADADEVHVLDRPLQGASTLAPASATHTSATRSAASRLPTRCAAQGIGARQRTEETGQRRRRAGQFRLRQHDRRTGIEQEARVRGLLVGDRAGQRDDDGAETHRSQLGHGQCTAAADDDVGPRVARRHIVDERYAFGRHVRAGVDGAQSFEHGARPPDGR